MQHPDSISGRAVAQFLLVAILGALLGWECYDPHISAACLHGPAPARPADGLVLEAGDDVVHPYGRILSKSSERDRPGSVPSCLPQIRFTPLASHASPAFRADPRFVIAPVRAPPA